ncbi:MAG: ABC transporter substrate-binding protein [Myxococcota bacterium]
MANRVWDIVTLLASYACLTLSFFVFVLGAMSAASARASLPPAPRRVVSMNLCTDQLAMLLAAPGQLYSVSYLAGRADSSVLATEARAYVRNHGLAEEIFLMKPDLILVGSYNNPATVILLKRLGFRVVTFLPANTFEDIAKNVTQMGELLGRRRAAAVAVAEMERELAGWSAEDKRRAVAALYYANSYTSGRNTLASEIVNRAGLENLGDRLGFNGTTRLPLELVVTGEPDFLVKGQSDGPSDGPSNAVLEHPALSATTPSRALVADRYWICGAPFTVEAVRRLARAKKAAVP